MRPILSVIIVAWRSRAEIVPCVRSIPAELYGGAVEVVVVDNSLNADGTADLLTGEAPQVRCIVPDENLGFGRANNLGFRETTGECVLFLNPDTVCNAAALEHCVRRARAEADIGLLSPKLVLADGSMDLACRRSIPTAWDGFCRASGVAARFPKVKRFAGYNLTYLPDDGTYEVGAINGAFMLGRREVFERVAERGTVGLSDSASQSLEGSPLADPLRSAPAVGQAFVQRASASDAPTRKSTSGVFDERFFMYGDDLDLCIRVSKAGYRIVYDGRVAITHLKGQSVAKDYVRMSAAIFDANRDVYLKHFNPRGSRLVAWRYRAAFGLWKRVARLRAAWRGHRRVRPV